MRGYNQMQYNTKRYNADGSSLQFSDTCSGSDASGLLVDAALIEFLTSLEFFQIQFSNKSLTDEIRAADWLSIDRRPSNHQWSN